MIIKEISFASVHYEAMKQFREEALRLPLGLTLSDDDLEGENRQFHIAAINDDGTIIGTALLKPLSQSRVKLRQMAVSPLSRRNGVGRKLVRFAEETALAMGSNNIELHARAYAQGFYEKLGYRTVGETFIEATLSTVPIEN
jgi:predicted GNAT family N-acyltransferase